MHALTTIMFTDDECRIFKTATLALRVAFPGNGDPTPPGAAGLPSRHDLTDGDDDRAHRFGHSLGQPGDNVTYDYLARARAVFAYARQVCERESDPALWFALVDGEPSEQTRMMTDAIVEARRRFVADVDEALLLLTAALTVATPKPPRDVWDDDLDLAAERVDAVLRGS